MSYSLDSELWALGVPDLDHDSDGNSQFMEPTGVHREKPPFQHGREEGGCSKLVSVGVAHLPDRI